MHQWVKEFHKWWPLFRVVVLHDSGSHRGSRASLVRSIADAKGILVTSYGGLVGQNEALLKHEFQYVVLDEGKKKYIKQIVYFSFCKLRIIEQSIKNVYLIFAL
jgi:DNA excision repair protein ERCC-6